MERLRLDRIISDAGIASRKEASQLIKHGFVIVDGQTAKSGADKFNPINSEIYVSGVRLKYKEHHYLMMNKPAEFVSATEDLKEKTVLDLLEGPYRNLELFPAGRLDKDAEGLLLLTDDGEWAHKVISPGKKIYKTYYVETAGTLTVEDAAAFQNRIVLKDGLECLPGELFILQSGEKSTAFVRIREGKYHQVKRMLASLGKPVLYLRRVSIGGLQLDEKIASGKYRELSLDEIASVFGDAPDYETLIEFDHNRTR